MGTKNARAAGKRDARNKARREQRAAQKAAKMAPQTPPAGLIDCETDPEPSVFGGGAASEATKSMPEDVPGGYSDRIGQIHGRPMMDPDLRLGRRSVQQPWDAKRVYDVRIVRATDNAVTMVKGLSPDNAERLMTDAVFSIGSDLVSVERTPRIEY